jgi:thymidine kinase
MNAQGEIIWGPMFAGKSTELILRLTRYADIGLKCKYINHSKDIRLTESSDSVVTTHNSGFQKLSSKITGVKASTLDEVDIDGYNVIGIDEGQFFDDIVEVVTRWIIQHRVKVIIASLDADFKRKPFGKVRELIGIIPSKNITGLTAICSKCDPLKLSEAPYTLKMSGSDQLVDIGGADKYCATCDDCWRRYSK